MKLNKPFGRILDMQRVIVNVASVLVILLITNPLLAQEFRSIDGFGNNLANPELGTTGAPLHYITSRNYSDGFGEPADDNLPNPRIVSNRIFAQEYKINDRDNHSDFVWAFGQFLDHDISAVDNGPEAFFIEVPADDLIMPPGTFIPMSRSHVIAGTGTGPGNPRQYSNDVTSFLDGSVVYGSTQERADWLRSNDGSGKLRVTEFNLLPWNTVTGERNDPIDPDVPEMEDGTGELENFFVAGDIRANENPLLLSLHTLFVREHNRLCDHFASLNPNWTEDQLYEKSRKMIGAYLQSITYEEWLPSIDVYVPPYTGYRESVIPNITNVFSAAAFRMGHTLLNSEIIRMDNDGSIIPFGNLTLKESFFQPKQIRFAGGIEPYIKGMATQVQQEMDAKVVDDVRNHLFGEAGPIGGLDLAAININRGRDRGLADYNTLRDDLGLNKLNSFSNLTSTQEEADALEEIYGDINNLDAWVGMLAEKHVSGSMFGELVNEIIEKQFQDLRDGDRFYYENDPSLTASEKEAIKATRLHDIIMRNCAIEVMQYDVFNAMPHGDIPTGPELVQSHLEAALYPNPVGAQAQLKVLSQKNEEVTVTIFDVHGRNVYSIDGNLTNGENFLTIDFDSDNWHRGFYTLVIRTENDFNTLKLIVE